MSDRFLNYVYYPLYFFCSDDSLVYFHGCYVKILTTQFLFCHSSKDGDFAWSFSIVWHTHGCYQMDGRLSCMIRVYFPSIYELFPLSLPLLPQDLQQWHTRSYIIPVEMWRSTRQMTQISQQKVWLLECIPLLYLQLIHLEMETLLLQASWNFSMSILLHCIILYTCSH